MPKLGICEVSDLGNLNMLHDDVLVDARAYFGYKYDVGDIPGKIDDAVNLICRNLEYGRRVIVFCDGGIDRSPFLVARTLQKWFGYYLIEAYSVIKKKRPQIQEHWEWIINE